MFLTKSKIIVTRQSCCHSFTSKLFVQTTKSIRWLNTSHVSVPPVVTKQDLLDEASHLTKMLYRSCLRSVRVIRWGNEFDEKEFQRREEDFLKPSGPDGRISMAPPPDKEDELRSRAEYYHSYARESFTQESDCLDNEPLRERDIKRYLYYLRKGEKDRQWLLADMMFPDPYKMSLDNKRVKRFEALAKRYLGEEDDVDVEKEPVTEQSLKDNFFDGDDEYPEWFKTKYPNLK